MRTRLAAMAVILLLGPIVIEAIPSSSPIVDNDEEITILRDPFGAPNIFAKTEEGAVYGMGYAQAEDRLEELLKQYRRFEGTMAEAFGPEFVQDDYRHRLWHPPPLSQATHPQ